MISLDIKQEATTSSPLNLSSTKEEPTLSFASLLKGVNPKEDAKIVQNGALVLSLAKDVKATVSSPKLVIKDTFSSLLKVDLKADEPSLEKRLEPLEINPKITQNMSVRELKTLIVDAKEYLKEKILSSDGYKKSELRDIPKTLKGLAELAKKVGVDVSKITIEVVQTKQEPKELSRLTQEQAKSSDIKKELLSKSEIKPEIKMEVKSQIEVKPQAELKSDIKVEVKPQAELKSDIKVEVKPQAELKNDIKVEVKPQTEVKPQEASSDLKVLPKQEIKEQVSQKQDNNTQDIKREIWTPKELALSNKTPLFKAQTPTEHTTEQLVVTKQFKVQEKTPLSRADETLKLLLRGEKPSQANSSLTADFSISTAKVIAPEATTQASKSLENLLRSDSTDTQTSVKPETATVLKTDSFEVKLNEAKQMIKYLSADVKTAIEDYKSPFTRVKIQLNPQKLGEVDVTIVQRGKNLHVNINSNTTAINTLATNVNELRAQLNNSGINNATFNFNSSSQGDQQNSSQQQNRQNERQAHEEYNHFESEESNEEILSSLEIVVPSYA